jgi:tetratricopeptide (TPR) repeat protein
VRATSGASASAFDCLDRARSLDPLSEFIASARGLLLYFANRVPESVEWLQDVAKFNPDHSAVYWLRCMVLSTAGEHEAAVASGEIALMRMGRMDRVVAYQAVACARAGRTEQARGLLAELQQAHATRYVAAYFPAMVLLALGEREDALAQLERGLAERDSMLRDVRVDRVWDDLRDEPRFQAIVEALRVPFRSAETKVLEPDP